MTLTLATDEFVDDYRHAPIEILTAVSMPSVTPVAILDFQNREKRLEDPMKGFDKTCVDPFQNLYVASEYYYIIPYKTFSGPLSPKGLKIQALGAWGLKALKTEGA